MIGLMDSAASNILKKLSWANIKATLKTYFDTLYTLANLGGVPTSRTVNNKALSSDITLTASDVGASASDHNHTGTYEPANANIQSHISSTNNPHGVTAGQVGRAATQASLIA